MQGTNATFNDVSARIQTWGWEFEDEQEIYSICPEEPNWQVIEARDGPRQLERSKVRVRVQQRRAEPGEVPAWVQLLQTVPGITGEPVLHTRSSQRRLEISVNLITIDSFGILLTFCLHLHTVFPGLPDGKWNVLLLLYFPSMKVFF